MKLIEVVNHGYPEGTIGHKIHLENGWNGLRKFIVWLLEQGESIQDAHDYLMGPE